MKGLAFKIQNINGESLTLHTDTLLNVFLAIAVDNLTNAEILTQDEEVEGKQKVENKLSHTLRENKKMNDSAVTFVNSLRTNVELTNYKDLSSKNVSPSSTNGTALLTTAPLAVQEASDGSSEEIHNNIHANGDSVNPAIVLTTADTIATPDTKRRKTMLFELAALATTSSATASK